MRDTVELEKRAQKVLGERYVQWQFSDGHEYRIPAWHFACERAIYYAEGDEARGDGEFMEVFEQELQTARNDSYEICDWASNNTNWEDVKEWAELVAQHPADSSYEDEWGRDLEVVEQDAPGRWRKLE